MRRFQQRCPARDWPRAPAQVEIKGDKIWVQQDGTEDGVVADLLAAGVPKDRIALGFKSAQSRARTDFAVG